MKTKKATKTQKSPKAKLDPIPQSLIAVVEGHPLNRRLLDADCGLKRCDDNRKYRKGETVNLVDNDYVKPKR